MDSTKQIVGSDVDNDQPEKIDEDEDSIGTGRSYECAFCKRGFTNAQALGGHMNIHRKDKAKAKQLITHQSSSTSPSTNKSSELDYTKYFSPISSTEQENYYYSTLGGQMNYQRYFPASTNPSFPHSYRPNFEFPSVEEDGNLRLGIGPPRMEEGEEKKEDDEEKRSRKGNEVDLELRLGHRP